MSKTSSYPICENDGFPMVTIGGRLQCVAEYLNRCLGSKRVVDMVQRDEVAYYVFEDGHELPLLCFCCGHPLHVFDLDQSRREIHGRRLEEFSVGMVESETGSIALQFRLEFSKKGLFSSRQIEPLSPEVAVQLQHPDDCLHKPRMTRAGKPRRKQPSKR